MRGLRPARRRPPRSQPEAGRGRLRIAGHPHLHARAVILSVNEESFDKKILHFVQDDGRMRIRAKLMTAIDLQPALSRLRCVSAVLCRRAVAVCKTLQRSAPLDTAPGLLGRALALDRFGA